MIFGDCPYNCGEVITLAMPAKPCWGKEHCPKCGREYWQRYSRLDPYALTAETFTEEYVVDENTREIMERNPRPELTEAEKLIQTVVFETLDRVMEQDILSGSGGQVPTGLIKTRAPRSRLTRK